jgi:hypothetical protein
MNNIWFWVLGSIAYFIWSFVIAYLFGTWVRWGRDDDD